MAKRKQRQKKQHPYAALSDFGGGTYYSEELGDVELAEADIVYWHECPTEAPDGYEWRKLTDKQRMQLCRQQLEDVLLALADMAADIRLVDAQALEHVLAVCAGAAKLVR